MIHDLDFYDLPSEVEGETKGAHHASVEFRSEYSCLVLLSWAVWAIWAVLDNYSFSEHGFGQFYRVFALD